MIKRSSFSFLILVTSISCLFFPLWTQEKIPFHCTHRCGELGSKSLQKIEWDFMLLMYQAHQITHYLYHRWIPPKYKNKPYTLTDSLRVNLNLYHRSTGFDSHWYQDMAAQGESLTSEESYFASLYHPFQISDYWCANYIHYGSRAHFWGFKPLYEEEKEDTPLAHVFVRRDFHHLSHGFEEGEEIHEWTQPTAPFFYRFDYLIDLHQACYDLKEEMDWLRNDIYFNFTQKLSHRKQKEKAASDKIYLDFTHSLEKLKKDYLSLFLTCAKKHHAPASFYKISLQHAAEGDYMRALEAAEKVFAHIDLETLEANLASSLCFSKGALQNGIALFDQALLSLHKAIQANPSHQKAYFERAITYFEQGDLHRSMKDFLKSGYFITPLDPKDIHSLKFAKGLIQGTATHGLISLQYFCPSMLHTLSGLSHGLWAFVCHPIDLSKELISACQNIALFLKDHGALEGLKVLVPEIKELTESWEILTPERQGELIGTLIGKYGTDFLLFAGIRKGVKAFQQLRQANATLTFEQMAKDATLFLAIEEKHRAWWNKTKPIIDQIKKSNGKNFDTWVAKKFKNTPLSELQVRQILHHCNFKTFPKPQGIPNNCIVEISKKSAGMVYRKAGTTKEQCILVRVMPGNPKSSNVMQKKPYVVQRKGKKHLILDGWADEACAESHIPLEKFEFAGW